MKLVYMFIIDDFLYNMNFLTFLLGKNNFKCLKANDAKETILMGKKFVSKIWLILLDLQLQIVNGLTLKQNLNKCAVYLNTGVIPSFLLNSEKEPLIQTDYSEFVVKPIHPGYFLKIYSNLFRKR